MRTEENNYHRTEVALMEKIKYKTQVNTNEVNMPKDDDNEYLHSSLLSVPREPRKSSCCDVAQTKDQRL